MNKKSALVNFAALILPLFMAVPALYGVFVFLYRPQIFLTLMCAAILIGFALFFMAKFSVYKAGNLMSFGYAKMTATMRHLYLAGYFLMLFGGCSILVWTLI